MNTAASLSSPISTSSFFPLLPFHMVSSTSSPFPAKYTRRCSSLEASKKMAPSTIRNFNPVEDSALDEEDNEIQETLLYSFTPLPLLFVAALPGAGTVRSLFGPFVELVKSWNLPEALVHWGHPGNMAVVLFAMGGYGTYLGFRIRFTDDLEEKAKAKDLHPKLLGGMFFFFALGATGGVTSLLTSDKPIFESPHAVTGFIGLALLTIQSVLPALFEGNSGLRNIHGILGSGIMTLFLVHAAFGLQLGLSS